MDDTTKLVLASSIFIVFYSMISKFLQDKLNIPDPISTMLYGIVIAKFGLDLFEPHYVSTKYLISIGSRIILCLQTMAVALSLPKGYIYNNFKSIFSLVIVIGFMKCFFTFLILRIFSYLDTSTCWAIAASLTPTDPILSSSIIKGKFAKTYVSEKISAESGINDGFGILMLGISFDILKNSDLRLGFYNFIVFTLGNKAILSGIIGYMIGLLVYSLTKICCNREMIRTEMLSIHTFTLCFFGLALMEVTQGSELICIFFMGISLNSNEWYTLENTSNKLSEILESILCKVLFISIGTTVDFGRFNFRMVLICALIIVVRRPLILFFGHKLVPLISNRKEALFVGWFGPIGVGALFYSLMYDRKVDTLTIDYVICTVLMSTVIHGLSVPVYLIFKRLLKGMKVNNHNYDV